MYIGNHLSSAKGYEAMGKQAVRLGGETFAFFTRNPRGGKAKEIKPEDVEKFLEIAKEQHFGKIVAHAPYTMNACAAKEDIRELAYTMFTDDLKRMEYTPGNYYNFHPGSHALKSPTTETDAAFGAHTRKVYPSSKPRRPRWGCAPRYSYALKFVPWWNKYNGKFPVFFSFGFTIALTSFFIF